MKNEKLLESIKEGCKIAIRLLDELPKKSNKQLREWLFNYISSEVEVLSEEYYYLSEILNRIDKPSAAKAYEIRLWERMLIQRKIEAKER